MNILFTICGRAGSKGIKNKNLMDFAGYALPFYTISAIDLFCRENPSCHRDIVLNTDSRELIKLCSECLNIEIEIIKRDISLGLDDTPKIDVIRNCLVEMNERKSTHYDMVVDLDITAPLRTCADVCKLVQKKFASDADVVFSVTSSRRNPYFNMVKQTADGYKRVIESDFNTRQQAPEIFDMNASLYGYSPEFLAQGKRIFEGKCDVIYMFDTGVLDLDHKTDLELMQVIAEYLFNKYPEYKILRNNIIKIMK